MRKIFFLLLFILLGLKLPAQIINGRFSSNLYMFENYTDADNSEMQTRGYQILNLNAGYGKFSLRSRLNLETDFSNTLSEDPRLRFYNLYLEGRDLFKVATIKIGRQTLLNSFGGLYDGVSMKLKISPKYSLTTYYGGNVPAYQKLELTDNLSEDYVMGAKFTAAPVDNLKFNFNYIDKNFKPDEYYATRLDADLNPINYLVRKNSNQYQFISTDVTYSQKGLFRLFTKADYDLNFKQLSKFQVSGRVEATAKIGLNVYYNYREPRLAYNSIFSVFNYGNSQEIEAGIDYKICKMFTVIGKYGYVKYDEDNSNRISVAVKSAYGSISYRKTLGYAGELDAISLHTAKSFLKGLLTPSVGLSYTKYKLNEDEDASDLFTLLAGVNLRPWKKFSFDIQTQYFQNEIFDNDFRILFRFNHWFNINLSSK